MKARRGARGPARTDLRAASLLLPEDKEAARQKWKSWENQREKEGRGFNYKKKETKTEGNKQR